MDERTVITSEEMARAVERLARELVERHGTDHVALIGIQRRGAVLARRLATAIAGQDGVAEGPPVGALDISLYRDDLSEIAHYPVVRPTELAFDITGRTVVLVDDVLFTGRTIRAALDALTDFGRPRAVRLAVLVDRGHRELPIKPDHVGRNLPTDRSERVNVHVVEIDGIDEVTLGRPSDSTGTAAAPGATGTEATPPATGAVGSPPTG